MDSHTLDEMKKEVEKILRRDNRFGSLHRLEMAEDEMLVLAWDDNALRQKAKAQQGAYLAFMEEISDCLEEFGYCLAAEEGANEKERNNYLLIVPEDDADFDEEP